MKSILLGIMCYLPVVVLGQLQLINRDLTNPDMSLLYSGIENHLTIVGQNDFSGFRLTSATKSDITIKAETIVIIPITNAGLDTLSLFKGKKLLLTKVFKVTRLSDPIAQLAFTSDTVISVNKILANPFLTAIFPNSIYKTDIVIKFFECYIYKKNGERNVFSTAGNRLSEEMLTAIKNLSSRDELVFNDIKAGIAPVFGTRKLPSIKLAIR
ncbi:hypothetical protein EXU57_24825 [Segetibacter sp. 3557_3]|uniref:GldM family protein n=1 Tax=Segetibacter sp. 3557_3 TaxID=2547429 RepID=UPI001058ACC6|nr:GldM family protein [Segetibacter sp. 3557_3]TDH17816.1 hypothetical protein EXU57_24825 [Segetibacter sp. 3557_3]